MIYPHFKWWSSNNNKRFWTKGRVSAKQIMVSASSRTISTCTRRARYFAWNLCHEAKKAHGGVLRTQRQQTEITANSEPRAKESRRVSNTHSISFNHQLSSNTLLYFIFQTWISEPFTVQGWATIININKCPSTTPQVTTTTSFPSSLPSFSSSSIPCSFG